MSDQSSGQDSSESRIEEIDLLRALAISMVVIHHLCRSILKGFVPDALSESWTGVDLFFLISGYLVTRSFVQWLERAGSGSSFMGRGRLALRYCMRRLVRVVPMAWLWAAIPLLASVVINRSGVFGDPSEVFRELIAVVGFYYNYFTVSIERSQLNFFWSLAVEEHYYLVLPFFLLFVKSRRSRIVGFVLVIAACQVIRVTARRSGSSFGEIQFLTHFRADALALGSVLGLFAGRIGSRGKNILAEKGPRYGAGLAVVLSVAFLWIAPSFLSRDAAAYYGFPAFSLASAFLVALAVSGMGFLPIPGALAGPMAAFGRRSYSLYLIHLPTIRLFQELRFRLTGMPGSIGWESGAYATAELIAYLLVLAAIVEANYRWVERPLIEVARARFSSPWGWAFRVRGARRSVAPP